MHPNAYLRSFWRTSQRPTVFVAMSFGSEYDDRFNDVFVPAITSISVGGNQLEAIRVDASKSGDSILTEIIDGIAHSMLILADISIMGWDSKTGVPYRNGNVMYEVGMALACRKPSEVLLVRDDHEKFLFDVSSIPHKTLDFTDTDTAIKDISTSLKDRLEETKRILDARTEIIASKLGPNEVNILKEMFNKSETTYTMSIKDPSAYSRLVDVGILELDRRIPLLNKNPTYSMTKFGLEVLDLLFKEVDA